MEYKGKLYGKVHKSYFPLEATTEDWDALKNRITQLEAENQALRQPPVVGRSEQLICPECENPYPHLHMDGSRSCEDCGHQWAD